MMPNYLNTKEDQPRFDELNAQLNNLPDLNLRPVEEIVSLRSTKRIKRNVGVETQRRILPPIKLDPTLWNDSSRLPPLQKKHSSATKASEATGGSSDKTKLDSPLEYKHVVQGLMSTSTTANSAKRQPTRVYSFRDLFSSTDETQIKAEERPLKQQKLSFGVDETFHGPMICVEARQATLPGTFLLKKRGSKRGVSLVERFTEEEMKLHIKSLKDTTDQCGIREVCDPEDDDECQLCGKGKLMFPPPPIHCSLCSRRIKHDKFYHTPEENLADDGQQQHHICNTCYTRSASKFELPSGVSVSKANMLKHNNADNQIEEGYVQCEVCEKWQHSICGLYNQDKDVDKTADYICPYCLLEEIKSINGRRFDRNVDKGAKDLPETILSKFLEQRLSKRLEEERSQTATASGKSINDVSKADDLTLRVVYSADKTSTVNKNYADFLNREKHYPSEFPYRSKVILLFQKVEGVDIFIFALFVQEFGSECSLPNQRSVYISYIDSVKYFRPERKTFSGEALRTFVYHEILIGYLEYCKNRGFATCYIWACPPQKGDDYIMLSHPKTQQTPNPRKLRQWYMSMLDKAVEQRVVTNVTNLHSRFFVSKEESTSIVTRALQLPYFEGSFWTPNAEVLIQKLDREGDKELQREVKSLSARKLKGMGYKDKDCVDLDDAKMILLMQKLEKTISKNKEALMVVELSYSCTRCSKAISGWRWSCDKCKNLQLCERCYDTKQELPGEHIYNKKSKEKHLLTKVEVDSITSTTEDGDLILENDIFESRQAFFGFSKKHNHNFDTLRRAKHSSMMILYHLHASISRSQNSNSLLQVTCTSCKKDVSTKVYFPCLICPNYRACTGCCTTKPVLRQLHLFPIIASTNVTPPRALKVIEILDALVHASTCQPTSTSPCSFLKCREVKAMFSHNVACKIKEKGACKLCTKVRRTMWIHAYHCQNPTCPISTCRDVKETLIENGLRL